MGSLVTTLLPNLLLTRHILNEGARLGQNATEVWHSSLSFWLLRKESAAVCTRTTSHSLPTMCVRALVKFTHVVRTCCSNSKSPKILLVLNRGGSWEVEQRCDVIAFMV